MLRVPAGAGLLDSRFAIHFWMSVINCTCAMLALCSIIWTISYLDIFVNVWQLLPSIGQSKQIQIDDLSERFFQNGS